MSCWIFAFTPTQKLAWCITIFFGTFKSCPGAQPVLLVVPVVKNSINCLNNQLDFSEGCAIEGPRSIAMVVARADLRLPGDAQIVVIPQAGKKPLLRERFMRGRVKRVQLHLSEWEARPVRPRSRYETIVT